MKPSLVSIATALPDRVLAQKEAAELASPLCARDDREASLLAAIYRRSGIDERRVVLPDRAGELEGRFFPLPSAERPLGPTTQERLDAYAGVAPRLAGFACREALAEAGTLPTEITHLVLVSCTGIAAPGVDGNLVRSLGLSPDVQRTVLGFHGCYGAISGIELSARLAASGACVLLCCVELCSLHFQYGWNPERIVANALFGDGAAACVVRVADRGWAVEHSASRLFPGTAGEMSWSIGANGFAMTLSARVPELLRAGVRPWLAEALAVAGVDFGEIGRWAVHPGGPRILSAVQESLELADGDLAPSREILRKFGNMSSPTVLFVLKQHPPEAGGLAAALAFGPGLTAAGTLLRFRA